MAAATEQSVGAAKAWAMAVGQRAVAAEDWAASGWEGRAAAGAAAAGSRRRREEVEVALGGAGVSRVQTSVGGARPLVVGHQLQVRQKKLYYP